MKPMRIVLVTDAWHPQINGVVTTLSNVIRELEKAGHEIVVVHPGMCGETIPCPTYPDIRLALFPRGAIAEALEESKPNAVHIATEGPLGWAARALCRRRGIPFTTSFHTRFPEYVRARFGVPLALSYRILRRFHSAAERTMVSTPTLKKELEARGFKNLALWARGVDTALFSPRLEARQDGTPPRFLYAGRVSVEKNIEAFLDARVEGEKVVVGSGPALPALKRRYPHVHFRGQKEQNELATHYRDADVFVFSSTTDTFGLVMLEANACGTPVAAYPVRGPLDVVRDGTNGCLRDDLALAMREALSLSRAACRAYAESHSWEKSARQFLDNLYVITR